MRPVLDPPHLDQRLAKRVFNLRFVVADAYTYGSPDLERAFAEAMLKPYEHGDRRGRGKCEECAGYPQ